MAQPVADGSAAALRSARGAGATAQFLPVLSVVPLLVDTDKGAH